MPADNQWQFRYGHFHFPILGPDWQYYELQFSPAASFGFISVRVVSAYETWVFLDDFSLECPAINLGSDTALCVVENIPLEAGPFFESYRWNNLSTEASIEVDEPGEYWVEAIDGACIIRDTIRIEEIFFNCGSQIYIPNVFSPNHDGINDEFRPFSPCELLDFELTVFDRWGQLAYHSVNAGEPWDGFFKGRPVAEGAYVYLLRYRFFYQAEANISYGGISIVR